MGLVTTRQDRYVSEKMQNFEKYFGYEITVLEGPIICYGIAYDILRTTVRRIRLVVEASAPKKISDVDIPWEQRLRMGEQRREFLSAVAEIIVRQARQYRPDDGSFWEDVREELNQLARWVRSIG